MQAVFQGAQAIIGDEGFAAMQRFREALLEDAPERPKKTDTKSSRRAWAQALAAAGAGR